MNTEDLIGVLIVATYAAMLAIEAVPGIGRRWPRLRLWRTKGTAFFVVLLAINALLPSLLPAAWLQHSLLNGRALGIAGGAIVGVLAMTLVGALLHRAYHRFDVLWRWVHQLHHSPQRLDVASAAVFSPQEVLITVAVFQLVVVVVLGLHPLAAAIVGYVTAFYALFQHFNIRTPQWLGWLIQRPESHCVHHRRGFHGYNYSDFPLWDMLMGTFRNPREFNGDVGFEGETLARVVPMLGGRDANTALYGPRSRGSRDLASNPA